MSPSNWLRVVVSCWLLIVLVGCLGPLSACDAEPDADVDLTISERNRGLTNSIGMKFVRIPAGRFLMGAAKGDKEAQANELPQHEVDLTKSYYLGVYEVTQKQYKQIMGKNPSAFSKDGRHKDKVKGMDTDDFPVELVTWEDVARFLEKLNALPAEKAAARKYRLPGEAEWEYACRAGSTVYRGYHFGDRISARDANYANKVGRPCKVGSYAPNAWGLYDMHGNVWEWCHDPYDGRYYATSPKTDPLGPARGSNKVHRGGAWDREARNCRSAFRSVSTQHVSIPNLGFRVALDAPRE
jgi:formylglycine-generating enzyme required for sulfatase activity